MLRDKVVRFLEAVTDWEKTKVGEAPKFDLARPDETSLHRFPGLAEECFFLTRIPDLDELTCEDDEQYLLSTTDGQVATQFNRFQIRSALRRAVPPASDERIELFLKLIWNFKRLAINRNTADYEYFDPEYMPATFLTAPVSGGIPRERIKASVLRGLTNAI